MIQWYSMNVWPNVHTYLHVNSILMHTSIQFASPHFFFWQWFWIRSAQLWTLLAVNAPILEAFCTFCPYGQNVIRTEGRVHRGASSIKLKVGSKFAFVCPQFFHWMTWAENVYEWWIKLLSVLPFCRLGSTPRSNAGIHFAFLPLVDCSFELLALRQKQWVLKWCWGIAQ